MVVQYPIPNAVPGNPRRALVRITICGGGKFPSVTSPYLVRVIFVEPPGPLGR